MPTIIKNVTASAILGAEFCRLKEVLNHIRNQGGVPINDVGLADAFEEMQKKLAVFNRRNPGAYVVLYNRSAQAVKRGVTDRTIRRDKNLKPVYFESGVPWFVTTQTPRKPKRRPKPPIFARTFHENARSANL